MRLTGQGADVVGLIDILNAAKFLDEAKFESTVSRNPRTGLDQFSVGAKLVGSKPGAPEQDDPKQDGSKHVGSNQVGAQEK